MAKRLLFCTIAAGGGHVATAHAMAQALDAYYPAQFDTEVLDYMDAAGFTAFDQRHKAMWRQALKAPALARLGQRVIDTWPDLTIRLQRRSLREFAQLAAQDMAARRPDLVVANHGLLTTALALAKRDFGLSVPFLTFATETHNISAYWADPWAEHVLVPNAEVGATLATMGVPEERLELTGYPVAQAFLHPPSQKAAREALGLPDRLSLLVSLGGEGVSGKAEKTVATLLDLPSKPTVIVVCGRNTALRERLEAANNPHLHLTGYVTDMATYLAASDVVVGKAGPASVHEALAVGRPVLVTSYVGLNERGLVTFLEDRGLGVYAPDRGRLLAALETFTTLQSLERVERETMTLDLAGQTKRVAEAITHFAERP